MTQPPGSYVTYLLGHLSNLISFHSLPHASFPPNSHVSHPPVPPHAVRSVINILPFFLFHQQAATHILRLRSNFHSSRRLFAPHPHPQTRLCFYCYNLLNTVPSTFAVQTRLILKSTDPGLGFLLFLLLFLNLFGCVIIL